MFFSAVSVVSLSEADDDTNDSVGVEREPPPPPPPPPVKKQQKNDYMLPCTLLIQLGLKQS